MSAASSTHENQGAGYFVRAQAKGADDCPHSRPGGIAGAFVPREAFWRAPRSSAAFALRTPSTSLKLQKRGRMGYTRSMSSGSLSLWRTRVVLCCGLMIGARGASAGAPASETAMSFAVTNLSQVREFASQNPVTSFAIALEGDIWWANGKSTRLVFKDDTGVEELEMDLPGERLRSGQRVRIVGAGTIIKRGAAFQIGSK